MLCNIADSVSISPPIRMDTEATLTPPFNLKQWIQDNRENIDNKGKLELFDCKSHQIQVRYCVVIIIIVVN